MTDAHKLQAAALFLFLATLVLAHATQSIYPFVGFFVIVAIGFLVSVSGDAS